MNMFLIVWGGLTVVGVIAGIVVTLQRPELKSNNDYVDYERALRRERVIWPITLYVACLGACAIPFVAIVLELFK